MDYINDYMSPLGGMTMASDGEFLIGLWFDGEKYFGESLSGSSEKRSLPVFDETKRWLDVYFRGEEPDFTPRLSLDTTPFRKRICELMMEIPYGRTVTYAHLARQIAEERGLKSMSAQAVGGAVGHNPISIIIPCHRVVGFDGSLTGYAGGIDKKLRLLQLEGISDFISV